MPRRRVHSMRMALLRRRLVWLGLRECPMRPATHGDPLEDLFWASWPAQHAPMRMSRIRRQQPSGAPGFEPRTRISNARLITRSATPGYRSRKICDSFVTPYTLRRKRAGHGKGVTSGTFFLWRDRIEPCDLRVMSLSHWVGWTTWSRFQADFARSSYVEIGWNL